MSMAMCAFLLQRDVVPLNVSVHRGLLKQLSPHAPAVPTYDLGSLVNLMDLVGADFPFLSASPIKHPQQKAKRAVKKRHMDDNHGRRASGVGRE